MAATAGFEPTISESKSLVLTITLRRYGTGFSRHWITINQPTSTLG